MFNVIFSVMQHHNIMLRDLRRVNPGKIFELATLGGANVLGLQDEIGSLEPGKKADIITLDLKNNSSLFPLSPQVFYSMLALNGAGSEACDVLVNGVFVRRDREFTLLHEAAIIARARQWCDKFSLDYQRMKQANQPMFHRIHEEFQPAMWRKS
jgi:cytosine/adenosine deaminase-related metal-dependent hydrolase